MAHTPSPRPSPLRAFLRRTAAVAMSLGAASMIPAGMARADVAGQMNDFFQDAGGAANVTGPSAYQGQTAGYYSMGNVWSRFPQKSVQPFNLQMPKVSAGCGGIDLFTGSFSFINGAEMVAMLKATANNALGFAFQLAIDSVSPEIGKVMDSMANKAQQMNQMNISSCEAAQGLGRIGLAEDGGRTLDGLRSGRQFAGQVFRLGAVAAGLRCRRGAGRHSRGKHRSYDGRQDPGRAA